MTISFSPPSPLVAGALVFALTILFSNSTGIAHSENEIHVVDKSKIRRAHSKVLTEPIRSNERRRRLNDRDDTASAQEETLRSKQAVFLGKCRVGYPFMFPVSAGNGHGVVGSTEESSSTLNIIIADNGGVGVGRLDFTGLPRPGFFAWDSVNKDDLVSIPFQFKNIPDDGVTAEVSCEKETDIVIIHNVNDDMNELGEVRAKATYRTSHHNSNNMESEVRISLIGMRAAKAIVCEGKVNAHKRSGETPNSPSKLVQVVDATDEYVIANYDGALEILLISAAFKDAHGRTVFRTFINRLKEVKSESNERRRMLTSNLQVENVAINADDDLEITFTNTLAPDAYMLYQILLSVVPVDEADPVADLETRAMLTGGEATLVVHGGWVRKKLYDLGVNEEDTEGWEIVLLDAHILDPDDGYRVVADLIDKNRSLLFHTTTEISKLKEQERRNGGRRLRREELLAFSRNPSLEEHEVSDDMKMGRRPVFVNNRRLDDLDDLDDLDNLDDQDDQKEQLDPNSMFHDNPNYGILIVHGWCSVAKTFDLSEFEGEGYDVFRFSDPAQNTTDPEPEGWSHNTFALKLVDYMEDNDIGRCSIVAHSQGGNAALHLYAYYWSCLDYARDGRLIQSVGTPYRGTELMNHLAEVADSLGILCGYLDDLSTGGADDWVSQIPDWARRRVYYYTTAFDDSTWFDYCLLATDFFLDDPDDGVVENQRAQLYGGNDAGLKRGWCHLDGMRDPDQTADTERNSEMRELAAK